MNRSWKVVVKRIAVSQEELNNNQPQDNSDNEQTINSEGPSLDD